MVYDDQELRQQASNIIAIETPRGFRIAKEKASKKIDAIVALSMACVAALDVPKSLKLEDIFAIATGDSGPEAIVAACRKDRFWFPH